MKKRGTNWAREVGTVPRLLDAEDYVAVILVAAQHLQIQDGSTVSAKEHLRL